MTEVKNIDMAIDAIYSEIGYVQKEGQVSFGNTKYKFAGEAAFIAALRPVMKKYHVTVHVKDVQITQLSTGHYIVINKYEFIHAPSSTTREVCSAGEGKDTGDKAIPKAMTGAYKYALRQTFMIETGDDPDNTSSEELEEAFKFKTAKERTKLYNDIMKELDATIDLDDLTTVWVSRKEDLAKLRSNDQQFFIGLENRKNELKTSFQAIANEV